MGWVDSQSDDLLANRGMREWIPGSVSFGGVRDSGRRRLPLQENMPAWGPLGDSVSAPGGDGDMSFLKTKLESLLISYLEILPAVHVEGPERSEDRSWQVYLGTAGNVDG